MTRKEHLDWAKGRALEYVDRGECQDGFASMISDLRKHPELENHVAIELGADLFVGGFLSTPEALRNFIEGFN